MVAEHGVWPHQEQTPEKICEQIADVHVPQVVEQMIEVPKMAEQILDVLVPEMVEQLVKQPKTIPQERIPQRTVEHITADTPVPQDVEDLVEFFKAFSQDRVQLRFRGQIIANPAITLAEKIIEMPVTQFTDKVVDIPVLAQRQISMVQPVQKNIEISQLQYCDEVIVVPVVSVVQVPRVWVVKKTVEDPQVEIDGKTVENPETVPQMQVVEKTAEIPQFRVAELLKFITFKPGDEQISFKEYVDRMKEGQNDIYCFTGESIADVSSRSFRELSHKKGYEVLYMADPVDDFAVQQPKESDGTKPKSTTKEDLEADIAKHTSQLETAETCVKDNMFMVAGEITVARKIRGQVDVERVRQHTGAAALQRQPHSTKQQPSRQHKREGEKKMRGQVEKEKGQ